MTVPDAHGRADFWGRGEGAVPRAVAVERSFFRVYDHMCRCLSVAPVSKRITAKK